MESRKPDRGNMPITPSEVNSNLVATTFSNNKVAQSSNKLSPPKRIIKTIAVDFNKLKAAGLDRKIAEALSRHKINAAATTTKSGVNSSSVPSQEFSSITGTHQQAQQLQRNECPTIDRHASKPIRKASIVSSYIQKVVPPKITITRPQDSPPATLQQFPSSELISHPTKPVDEAAAAKAAMERSMWVKELIKKKILKKTNEPVGELQTQMTQPEKPHTSNNEKTTTVSGNFLTSIPKADLTVRKPKQQPLLLNTVNQLPARRARCPISKKMQTELETDTSMPSESSPASPLVLEHKVLAPDEKIDICGLQLPVSTSTTIQPKKILNADKLKVPREKITQMAKAIRNQWTESSPSTASKPKEYDNDMMIALVVQSPKSGPKQNSSSLMNKDVGVRQPVKAASVPTSSPKILSAVDFIAQLAASNPGTENMMELSPEELSLSATFGLGQSDHLFPAQSKSDDLAIGNIVEIQNMNILHATMDVVGDSGNVLRISPNTTMPQSYNSDQEVISIKVEKNPQEKDVPQKETTKSLSETIGAPDMEPTNNSTSTNSLSTPIVRPAGEETTQIMSEPLDQLNNEARKSTLPVRRPISLLMKSKINLVQRNKRAIEATKPQANKAVADVVSIKKEEAIQLDTDNSQNIVETDGLVNSIPKRLEDGDKTAKLVTGEHLDRNIMENAIETKSITTSPINEVLLESNTESQLALGTVTTRSDYVDEPENTETNFKNNKSNLSQFFNPPKITKYKQQQQTENNDMVKIESDTEKQKTVSLRDVLSQEAPPVQGLAQVPFRSSPATCDAKRNIDETVGITNLVTHLARENVVVVKPQVPADESGMAEETKYAEEECATQKEVASKVFRKKLFKARPVLGKRPSKQPSPIRSPKDLNNVEAVPNQQQTKDNGEAVKPKSKWLQTEVNSNNCEKVTCNSNDDDSNDFFGFDDIRNKTPKVLKRKKERNKAKKIVSAEIFGTDISDDSTPASENDDFVQDVVLNYKKQQKDSIAETMAIPESAVIQSECESVEHMSAEVEPANSTSNQEAITNSVDTSIAVPIEDALANTANHVPKKRGRKPKITVGATPTSITDYFPTSASTSKQEATPIPQKLRRLSKTSVELSPDLTTISPDCPQSKRGRKPKNISSTTEKTEISSVITPATSRRGRKPKNLSDSFTSASGTNEEVTNTPITNKRGRMSNTIIEPSEPLPKRSCVDQIKDTSNDNNDTDEVPLFQPSASKRRVGRPRTVGHNQEQQQAEKPPTESDFSWRLLLISKREQLDTEEELRPGAIENGSGEGAIQCGLCLVRTSKNHWLEHLREHYGVGWFANQQAPTLTRSAVLNMMVNYLKNPSSPKKLICRLCGRQLGSALGMMLHLEGCGIAPQRFECPNCKKSYTKLSLLTHERTCWSRKREEEDAQKTKEADQNVCSEPVFSNSGRAKRRSTLKAEQKLKKIGAQLENHKDIPRKDFEGEASDYDVRKDKESSEEYDSEGVNSNDDDILTENECDNNGEMRGKSSKAKSKIKSSSLITSVAQLYGRNVNAKKVVEKVAERWNDFKKLNYSSGVLYEQLLPQFIVLSPKEVSALLPTQISRSVRYAYGKKPDGEWAQLKRLQNFHAKTENITYLGAPIKQLCWVPLPASVKSQYLLCSLRPQMHAYTRHTKTTQTCAHLMLLKCTLTANVEKDQWPLDTCLHYSIVLRSGAVHSFAFMPSGGYDVSANRLGLMAVGGASSDINIYALPLDADVTKDEAFIELKPVLVLTLEVDRPVLDQCVKLVWSESAGHNFLAAGFAHGNIAFWGIGEEHSLNCVVRNNQKYYLPVHFFYFGERNIKFLELHYDCNGPRWIAIATVSRNLWIYDIANWTLPVPVNVNSIAIVLASVHWPPVWETIAYGCSEVYKKEFPRLVAVNPTGVWFTSSTIDHTLSSARAQDFSSQLNVQLVATDNGDVVFINTREMNMESMITKDKQIRRTVAMTEAHKLIDEPNKEENKYISTTDFESNYGLLLTPLRGISLEKKRQLYLNENRRPHFDLLSMLRYNSAHFNRNAHYESWAAVGGEHGLLRIFNFSRG
ncbi:uncharacterized protein LOC115622815 isoform X2 [Scaptodrosophila lebanonensis]|uniref:Uncharacterized protein LOC115622815 isoform X2 n=1 Tax=Drosophila lebanonensis TaxID=7225 RepID=A0A6J2TC94_DROLE|nr:uncharacterized protein LOC115622815 isoform X2 [Scaptodrosophila lebanonensis]